VCRPDAGTILIVDDEPDVRAFLAKALGRVGHRQVRQADSVAAARALMKREGPFALVLLDLRLPDGSGMALLEEISPQGPGTVAVMVTAVAELDTAVQALKAGAYDYLVKPLLPEAVQLAVARALRKRRLELEAQLRQQSVERLVEERTRDLEATRRVLLFALCQMAEFRDAETGAHLRRIAEYARVLALDMAHNSPYAGLITEPFIAQLVETAPLHDIGKVAVPDNILLKPGRLSREEFEQMKRHTVAGRDLCLSVRERLGTGRSAAYVDVAACVAAHHHERWDGAGYPDGLKGSDIPLEARIVHLADFYDACRSRRVYRPEPVPRRDVAQMIRRGGGSDLDPSVVDSFERTRQQFVRVEETHAE